MGAWPPPSGSLAASWPLSCGRPGAPGRPQVMSAGDSGPPPGEAATGCRSPEPWAQRCSGGISRRRPTCDLGSAPDSRGGSGEIRVPGLQMPERAGRRLRGRNRCGAGAQHSSSCLCRAKRGCRGARSTWRERQPGAPCSASPPAVCSTATRGRCALVLHVGRQGLGCGGDPCAFLLWIRRILAFDAHCQAVQW